MQHLLHGLERYGLGTRTQTEHDFHRICEIESVDVYWSAKRHPFYFAVPQDALKVIVLPKRLTGDKLLFAAWHELAHALGGSDSEPCIAFLGKDNHRGEAEADAIALIAMFPDIHEPPLITSRFIQQLWDDRLRLYFQYHV